MKNKGFLIFLFITISFLCVLFLSFSFIARKVNKDAEIYAEGKGPEAANHYLDSIWDKPVVNLLGVNFTYQEIKEKELNLGLDLKGGMHVVLEVSASDLLTSLAANPGDLAFKEAMLATEMQHPDAGEFVSLFTKELKKRKPEINLAHYFAILKNQDHISSQSSDQEIIDFLNQEINQSVDRSFQILRNRIDRFGVANPNIQRLPGSNRIQVELAGVDNPDRVRKLLQGMANLEFWEVWTIEELMPVLQMMNVSWMQNQAESLPSAEVNTSDSLAYLLNQDTLLSTENQAPVLSLLASSYQLAYAVDDTAQVNQFLMDPKIKRLIPSNLVFKWGVKADLTGEKPVLELFALKSTMEGPVLQGNIINNAEQNYDQGPSVSMTMNGEGAAKWSRITERNIGRQIAIVLDDLVYTAPVVQSEIPNGHSSITGNFTIEEAKDLSNILETGKMPAKVNIVEEAVVGPTLGQEAISQGLFSLLAGLSLVVLFMMIYYGKSGSVANLAVAINMVWILGILAQFGAALTLPGMAGLVLTIGMAVDANVLIFERIKEELKGGMTLAQAIKTGYDKAYSSILDANITTFLTGLILYTFGTGGVKGFAILLLIGVVCSVLTAVFVTRMILVWMNHRQLLRPTSFHTPFSGKMNFKFNFDFVKHRRIAYFFSLSIIVCGLIALIWQKGFNLGVDFKGGRSYIVAFEKEVPANEVKAAITQYTGNSSLEVKTYNQAQVLKITTSHLMNDPATDADEKVKAIITQGLAEFDEFEPQIIGSSKVGPALADDFKEAAWQVVFFSLAVIFLYIVFRFRKWQYGLGATIALLHDVLMIFAFYAILGLFNLHLEIDQVFIAALLTIIGYSINDTVVVFDRIREFAGKMYGKNELNTALNPAINNTLSRTIITSLTVLLVVVVLLIFGGEALRGFSLALLVGVIFGTYSSIFIAAPIVIDFYKPVQSKVMNKPVRPLRNAA